jgi:hypothetical protein
MRCSDSSIAVSRSFSIAASTAARMKALVLEKPLFT